MFHLKILIVGYVHIWSILKQNSTKCTVFLDFLHLTCVAFVFDAAMATPQMLRSAIRRELLVGAYQWSLGYHAVV